MIPGSSKCIRSLWELKLNGRGFIYSFRCFVNLRAYYWNLVYNRWPRIGRRVLHTHTALWLRDPLLLQLLFSVPSRGRLRLTCPCLTSTWDSHVNALVGYLTLFIRFVSIAAYWYMRDIVYTLADKQYDLLVKKRNGKKSLLSTPLLQVCRCLHRIIIGCRKENNADRIKQCRIIHTANTCICLFVNQNGQL